MNTRSSQAIVRNPVLALPGLKSAIEALPPEARAALRTFLVALRDESRRKADECWRKHKAPMACYWKAVGVYANHLSRAVNASAGATPLAKNSVIPLDQYRRADTPAPLQRAGL
jgi:uncharacterized membrane protein